jgi:hypothetical protein
MIECPQKIYLHPQHEIDNVFVEIPDNQLQMLQLILSLQLCKNKIKEVLDKCVIEELSPQLIGNPMEKF